MSQPTPRVITARVAVCGSSATALLFTEGTSSSLLARVRVRLEIQRATAAIGYVGVELGRGEIRVTQHLLDRAQVGAAFEQVRRE